MKVLITGFDPFGGEKVNPAFEAVKLLPDTIAGASIVKKEVPTVFGKAGDALEGFIREEEPEVVICIGQAGGRSSICPEKVAINLMDARIPDNQGNQPTDQPIKEDGENAYFATVPVKAMVNRIRKKGIPAVVSYSAGTFVCNEIMYRLLYLLHKKHPDIRGGFIHVPYAAQQAVDKANGTPFMSLAMIADGLAAAVEAAVDTKTDEGGPMGTIM